MPQTKHLPVRHALLAIASAIAVIAVVPSAVAQTSPSAGSLMQTLPAAPARSGSEPALEDRLQKARRIADVEGLKVDVKGFRLAGLTVVAADEAQAVVKPFMGPGKKFQDLLDAAAAVRAFLAGKGYFLADAVIPEQSLKDGIVEILVMEGKLAKVKIEAAADVGVSSAHLEGYLAALQEGSVIQTRTIERAVFLLSDLKGVNIRTIFEPGDKIGTANLIVQVTRARAIEGNLDIDANGSYYTGVLRVGGGIDFNNPAGIGDVMSVRYARSAQNSNLEYRRASYLAPVGHDGLKLGAAYSELTYHLGTPAFDPLGASGAATVASGIAAFPLIRSRNMNLIVTGQLDARAFRDRQEATRRFTDKNTKVTTVSLGGDVRDALLGDGIRRGAINVFNLAFTRGNLAFVGADAATLQAADLAGHQTAGSFEKTNFAFSRLQNLSKGLAFYFAYNQQVANKNLDSSEKFSLGGPNAVRAYPQGEGSGDEGWTATAELRFQLPVGDTLPGTLVLTAFHDSGESRLNKNMIPGVDLINRRNIAGAGIGINWEVERNWSLRGSIAGRLDERPLGEGINRDPRVYLQFTKAL